MRIGVISDTHNFLDPRVKEMFAGVDHILHAGDIGTVWITFQLEQIAPVTAVSGNTDADLNFKETELIKLANHRFLIQHIVDPLTPDEKLRRLIAKEKPHFVVFGHTHKSFDRTLGDVRFFNPGYSGLPKFNQPRTVAILHADGDSIAAEVIPL